MKTENILNFWLYFWGYQNGEMVGLVCEREKKENTNLEGVISTKLHIIPGRKRMLINLLANLQSRKISSPHPVSSCSS